MERRVDRSGRRNREGGGGRDDMFPSGRRAGL